MNINKYKIVSSLITRYSQHCRKGIRYSSSSNNNNKDGGGSLGWTLIGWCIAIEFAFSIHDLIITKGARF